MIKISVRSDIRAAQGQLRRLEKGLRGQAIAAALNRTAEQARTAAVRDITAAFELKAAYVRERIKIRRASARLDQLEVALSAPGRRSANLIRFPHQQRVKYNRRAKTAAVQLYVKVRRRGKYRHVPGAFIANKGRTVFRRIGKSRLPIEALTTIDVPQAMLSEIGILNLRRAVAEVFPKRLAHEIERLAKGSAT